MNSSPSNRDMACMARAVELALRGKGRARPNPCVGAVLVRDGEILAEGWHTACGRPHAERECLADARAKGVDPAGAAVYVTLEPCNHFGRTPPCTEAVLEAGVAEVVIGCLDPNPDVAGGGAERLRQAGVSVRSGVLEQECRDLIHDFCTWIATRRTYNVLKMAQTIDGRIAGASGRPEPVSCPDSFAEVQRLRSRADAVMVGGETLRRDNPRLTTRLDDLPDGFRQPLAVVVTSRLPAPDADLHLLRSRPGQTVFFTTSEQARADAARGLKDLGVGVYALDGGPGGLDLASGLERLRRERGCLTMLCEGGGRLAMSLLERSLADEIVIFLAPRVLGDASAPSVFSGRAAASMAQALNLRLAHARACGTDLRLTYKPLELPCSPDS
ncbi:MAG: bifunctional diaminohydroxyphosphoribosylaminopyrimidine deaminase/5-amino-6-(5-phosphoribosylamino)uracil reductase RibD [Desulfovibrionaceae bacterium]